MGKPRGKGPGKKKRTSNWSVHPGYNGEDVGESARGQTLKLVQRIRFKEKKDEIGSNVPQDTGARGGGVKLTIKPWGRKKRR